MNTLRPPTSLQRPASGPSLLAALALTGAMLVVVLLTSGRLSAAWFRADAAMPVAERVTFVAPPPIAVLPIPRAIGPAARTTTVPARAVPSAPSSAVPSRLPGVPTAARDTGSGALTPGAASTILGGRAAAGVPAPTLSFPSGRTHVETVSVPLTPDQMDSALAVRRAEMMDPRALAAVIAEGRDVRARAADQARTGLTRATGGATSVKPVVGVSISTGLLGGPISPAQRKKNEAIDADVRGRLSSLDDRARVQARVDSLRRRDSLRLALDSARGVPLRRDSL